MKNQSMPIIKFILPIVIACACNALANMFWKMHFSKNPLKIENMQSLISSIFSFKILVGVILYIVSMFLFFYLLSNYKLSVVVPLTSLTYIFNIIIAFSVFKETLIISQIVGIFVIITGIFLVSKVA